MLLPDTRHAGENKCQGSEAAAHGSDEKGDYWRLWGEQLNTGRSSQSQWLHSKNAVAHLHNCVCPQNTSSPCKTSETHCLLQPLLLRSAFKTPLQGAPISTCSHGYPDPAARTSYIAGCGHMLQQELVTAACPQSRAFKHY